MVVLPADTGVTTPELAPMVATDVWLLVHVPLPEAVNVLVLPVQAVEAPEIAGDTGLTVTVIVAAGEHPLA